jgi:protein arginine kinase activator
MTCSICKTTEANVHIQEIVDGTQTSLHLCGDCAAQHNLNPDSLSGFALGDFLSKCEELTSDWPADSPAAAPPKRMPTACGECGLTVTAFRKHGRLGCPACYDVFYEPLAVAVLPSLHRGLEHCGKILGEDVPAPSRAGCPLPPLRSDPAMLERQLEAALKEEDYERAAELRDRISEL